MDPRGRLFVLFAFLVVATASAADTKYLKLSGGANNSPPAPGFTRVSAAQSEFPTYMIFSVTVLLQLVLG